MTMRFIIIMSAMFVMLVTLPHSQVRADIYERLHNAKNTLNTTDIDFTAGPLYRRMARQVLVYIPPDFSFNHFRNQYARSEYYTPDSVSLNETLMKHAFDVVQAIDAVEIRHNNMSAEKLEKSLERYHAFLFNHLANIGVLRQARFLAKQDKRFGKPDTYDALIKGIMKSVEKSGTGKTLNGAYDVITMEEEVALLLSLGQRVLKTDSRYSGRIYYNMHLVELPNSDLTNTVFVNTSIPMRNIAALHEIYKKEKPPADLSFKGLDTRG